MASLPPEIPEEEAPVTRTPPEVRVRRIHRRDLNRTWEFLKLCFRDVNRETVEYQRPRLKQLLPPRRLKRAPPQQMVEALRAMPPPKRKKPLQ